MLLILAVPGITLAQLVTVALRGAVTDPQGAAVSDAEVTITDMGTAFTRTVTASSDGVYNFPDLPLGSYRLRVSHPGFKAAEWTGIVLHVADSVVINVKLEVGPVSEPRRVNDRRNAGCYRCASTVLRGHGAIYATKAVSERQNHQ